MLSFNDLGIEIKPYSTDEKPKLTWKHKCDSFSSSCLQGIEKSSSGSMLSSIVGPGVFLIYKHLLLNRTTIALTVWGGLKHMK